MNEAVDLTGKRILVVEDDYFIAAAVTRTLRAAGATVIGPAGDLEKGLRLAEEATLDAALLDVNLDSEASFPIARVLRAGLVPHLFLTGYDDWAIPVDYRETPRITKPFSDEAVLHLVAQLCSARASE